MGGYEASLDRLNQTCPCRQDFAPNCKDTLVPVPIIEELGFKDIPEQSPPVAVTWTLGVVADQA